MLRWAAGLRGYAMWLRNYDNHAQRPGDNRSLPNPIPDVPDGLERIASEIEQRREELG